MRDTRPTTATSALAGIAYSGSRGPRDPLPLDAGVARAYGRIFAAVTAGGRAGHRRRAFDLLIAATARRRAAVTTDPRTA